MLAADPGNCLVFEDFVLDRQLRMLRRGKHVIDLRPQSFDVLEILATHPGQLVTREDLRKKVWQDRIVTDDSLTHCIVDVRRALGDTAQRIVRTIRGRGYVFEADVSIEPADSTLRLREGAVAGRRRIRSGHTLLAALAGFAIALAWWLTGRMPAGAPPDALSLHGEATIAVLPFINISPDPDQAYFADGISEELLNLLAKIPELRVISRSSSFAFRGKDVSVPHVAQKLDVSHVLEGSVRKSGDRIRVTAQLIHARTDTHLWSQTFEREMGDVFDIQDEIAMIVAGEIESRLVDRLRPARRTDLEAFALFLKGRSLAYAGGAGDVAHAERLFRRAIEIDPEYAPAWSMLALTIYRQTSRTENVSSQEKYSRSQGERLFREAFQQALAADPLNGLANAYLGWEMFFDENDPAGVGLVEKALANEPNDVEVVRTSGAFARAIGHWESAVALGLRAIDLDPLCQYCYWSLTAAYFFCDKLNEAEAVARRRVAIFDQGKHALGQVLLAKGDAEAALLIFDEIDGPERAHGRALALYSLGREEESLASLAEFIELAQGQSVMLEAMAYAWRGEIDYAFERLDKSWHSDGKYLRFDFFINVAWHPMYRNLHGDPRWQSYWEAAQTSPRELQSIPFRVRPKHAAPAIEP